MKPLKRFYNSALRLTSCCFMGVQISQNRADRHWKRWQYPDHLQWNKLLGPFTEIWYTRYDNYKWHCADMKLVTQWHCDKCVNRLCHCIDCRRNSDVFLILIVLLFAVCNVKSFNIDSIDIFKLIIICSNQACFCIQKNVLVFNYIVFVFWFKVAKICIFSCISE